MDEEVVVALKKIGKGSILIVLGMAFYQLSSFLFRVFLARGLPVSGFGEVSFGFSVIVVGTIVATLGLVNALPREIAYHRRRAKEIATTGVLLTILSSLLLFIFLYLLSPFIPLYFPGISRKVFLVFSFSLFFVALLRTIVAVGRGFEDVYPAFWFQYLLPSLALLSAGYLVFAQFHDTFLASVLYLATFLIASLLALFYVLRKGYLTLKPPSLTTAKNLLFFSLPLLLSIFIWNLFSRMDIFMIGYFLGSSAVGVYNSALTVVRAIPFFLVALNFLYLPAASSLISKNKTSSLRRLYQVITKWITVATVPIFFVALLFPNVVLNFFFGGKYLEASLSLMILAVAFGIHSSLGANGLTVLAFGDNRFIFRASLATAILNFLLNLLLVPAYGISGAALATGTSLIMLNALYSLYLYRRKRIHPFTRKYFLPYVISAILLLPLKLLDIPVHGILTLTLILLIYLFLYGFLLYLLKIYEREDAKVLKLLLRKLNIKTSF